MMNIRRVISTIEKNYIIENLKKGERIDDRGLWEYRKLNISHDVITSAEGSAEVTLGQTKIITGLKYEVGEPFPDVPDEGVCTIMAELLPLASPLFERGPPDEQSIELARVVDRGIRHADCIQTKKLCIKENEAVYILFVDMYVMNYAGNLIDAGGISALTALISSRIPEGKWEDGNLEWTGKYLNGEDLVKELPLIMTYGKIGDIIFLDPNLPEELVSEGRISISVTKDKIVSIQKSGPATFSIEEIQELTKKSMDLGKQIRDNLNLWQYKLEKD
jgi:exosome complex component RRP42